MFFSHQRIMRTLFIVVLFCGIFTGSHASAESTYGWIPIAYSGPNEQNAFDISTPTLGGSYLTVEFKTAKVYQKANWWTALIERNRKAVLDVTVHGQVSGVLFDDTRTSEPREIRRSKSQMDFGWSQILIERFPTTYSKLEMKVRISKTADDGLDSLLTIVSDISKKTPGLSLSQSTLGVVSASKTIADYLFNKRLLESKLSSTLQFPSSGRSLPAGYYVAFAGDTSSDYNRYLTPPTGSNKGLCWNGIQLLWNDLPVENVTYFVVKVTYVSKIFDNTLDCLSLNAKKPWADLYSIARRKPELLRTRDTNDQKQIMTDIRSNLENAHTLLDKDPDYIQSEKDIIHDAIRSNIEIMLKDRIAKLSGSTYILQNERTDSSPSPTSNVGENSDPALAPLAPPPSP